MNKTIGFIVLYVSLFIVEILISFIVLILIDTAQYGIDKFFINKAWYDTGLWNFWRVLFYGMPLIILYFLLFNYVKNIKLYKPLLLSLFNLSIYILLSILSIVVWGDNVPLPPEGIMFWITCLSIFLSPLLLIKFQYFNKLMGIL